MAPHPDRHEQKQVTVLDFLAEKFRHGGCDVGRQTPGATLQHLQIERFSGRCRYSWQANGRQQLATGGPRRKRGVAHCRQVFFQTGFRHAAPVPKRPKAEQFCNCGADRATVMIGGILCNSARLQAKNAYPLGGVMRFYSAFISRRTICGQHALAAAFGSDS